MKPKALTYGLLLLSLALLVITTHRSGQITDLQRDLNTLERACFGAEDHNFTEINLLKNKQEMRQ